MLPELVVVCLTIVFVVAICFGSLVRIVRILCDVWQSRPLTYIPEGEARRAEQSPAEDHNPRGERGNGADEIPREVRYKAFLDAFHHSESARWQRLNYYLVANSILLVAWVRVAANLQTGANRPEYKYEDAIALAVYGMPILGFVISGLFFLFFILRDRPYVPLWAEKGKWFEELQNPENGPYFFTVLKGRWREFPWFSRPLRSENIIPFIVWFFWFGYSMLLGAMFCPLWTLCSLTLPTLVVLAGVLCLLWLSC